MRRLEAQLPDQEQAPLRSRKAGRVVDAIKQPRVPVRSGLERAGGRSTKATCTEHHEGGTGRMHLCGAGPAPGKPPPACARIHLRIPDGGEAARSPRTPCGTDRGPAPRLLARLSAGAASARAPFATPSAPHGRARPRGCDANGTG